jgi:hypothetical protein
MELTCVGPFSSLRWVGGEWRDCNDKETAAASTGIWSVHAGNLSRDFAPFELPFVAQGTQAGPLKLLFLALKELLPLEEFVGEAKVWLDDDVETAGADEAVCSREREVQGSHDLGDADGGAA